MREQVEAVRAAAEKKKDLTVQNERCVVRNDHTYRELYDTIGRWAKDFQSVRNIIVQADPGYSALPWALVCITIIAVTGESETYHTTLEGTAYVWWLIIQYSVIETAYSKIDSKLAKKLKEQLEGFYVSLLKYQIFAINYFDADHKMHRALAGLNPVKVQ